MHYLHDSKEQQDQTTEINQMPKKTAVRTGKQVARHSTGQGSRTSKEDTRPAGTQAIDQKLKVSQMDPYKQYRVSTSGLYPDVGSFSVTGEQVEKCRNAAVKVRDWGDKAAKGEYRRQYMSLMQTDRTSLQTRSDSGEREATKQWDRFCQDSLKLLILRGLLYNKQVAVEPVGYGHPMRDATSAEEPPSCFSFTDSEFKELGKIKYTAYMEGEGKGGGEIVVDSDVIGDLPVLLDMSQWVHKGAVHGVSNSLMQKWMVVMRKQYGQDMQAAKQVYQFLLNEIKDVDEEQLRNQAHAGITKDSLSNYMLFCDQCFQSAVLWQIIYDKPIPMKSKLEDGDQRDFVSDFEKQWRDARGFDDSSLLA